ncbi:MAG: hypothetical protein HY719_16390 [Planctomycetes bacterium]|nr:hypothetical protein [Planctomycetota bacterium]
MASFDDDFFSLLVVNAGFATQKQVEECLHAKEADGKARHLGWWLVSKGYLDQRRLEMLINIQTRDVEDRPPISEAENLILADIMEMKTLAAHGDVEGCERTLARIEALEPYVQLAKVLVVKAQVAQGEIGKSNRVPPVPE